MSSVGSIRGRLCLQIGSITLDLGEVSIPLKARTLPRHDSGSPEIAVELKANLEEVRDTIGEIFRGGDA